MQNTKFFKQSEIRFYEHEGYSFHPMNFAWERVCCETLWPRPATGWGNVLPLIPTPTEVDLKGGGSATIIIYLGFELNENRIWVRISQAIAVNDQDELVLIKRTPYCDNLWEVKMPAVQPRALLLAWLQKVRCYETEMVKGKRRIKGYEAMFGRIRFTERYAQIRKVALKVLKRHRKPPTPGQYSHRGTPIRIHTVRANGDVFAEDQFGTYLTHVDIIKSRYRKL